MTITGLSALTSAGGLGGLGFSGSSLAPASCPITLNTSLNKPKEINNKLRFEIGVKKGIYFHAFVPIVVPGSG